MGVVIVLLVAAIAIAALGSGRRGRTHGLGGGRDV